MAASTPGLNQVRGKTGVSLERLAELLQADPPEALTTLMLVFARTPVAGAPLPQLAEPDRIIVLRDGRIEVRGSLDHLPATCTEMQRLWHGELGEAEPAAAPEDRL